MNAQKYPHGHNSQLISAPLCVGLVVKLREVRTQLTRVAVIKRCLRGSHPLRSINLLSWWWALIYDDHTTAKNPLAPADHSYHESMDSHLIFYMLLWIKWTIFMC
ncbi:hypothetical protein L1049_024509 [Liquidambar formosana]|uniref:Uncharacterized protein n=1 Tax=Liquidambar formosana TaxID=63359 RepID=A0AAP0RUK0_LIQFO